jgi:hypothetical protein
MYRCKQPLTGQRRKDENTVSVFGAQRKIWCASSYFAFKTPSRLVSESLYWSVIKNLTLHRVKKKIFFLFCHHLEQIRSFPTMYNTWGCSWGQIGEGQNSQKAENWENQKTIITFSK